MRGSNNNETLHFMVCVPQYWLPFLTIRCNVEHFLSLFLEVLAGTFAEIWYRHFLFMNYLSILCSIISSVLKVLPSHKIILYALKLHVTIKHIFLYFNKKVSCLWSSFCSLRIYKNINNKSGITLIFIQQIILWIINLLFLEVL